MCVCVSDTDVVGSPSGWDGSVKGYSWVYVCVCVCPGVRHDRVQVQQVVFASG